MEDRDSKLQETKTVNLMRILFVTDIHLSFSNVQRLAQWQNSNNVRFDVILIGGDTANCDQNDKTHDQSIQLQEANKILIRIQEIFGCRMFFIPGNHDPLQHYQKGHLLNQQIQSVHQRTVEIGQGLQVVGFGGSVPGYLDKQQTQQIWKGYPFSSNNALSQYCKENYIFNSQNTSNNHQRIYLTHCGPFDYETSIDRRQPSSPIYGGAKYYNSLIEHENLLLYLHGHVHAGSRFSKVKQVSIINPGNLSGGEFGYFVLQKNHQSDQWKIKSCNFVQL